MQAVGKIGAERAHDRRWRVKMFPRFFRHKLAPFVFTLFAVSCAASAQDIEIPPPVNPDTCDMTAIETPENDVRWDSVQRRGDKTVSVPKPVAKVLRDEIRKEIARDRDLAGFARCEG